MVLDMLLGWDVVKIKLPFLERSLSGFVLILQYGETSALDSRFSNVIEI